MRTKGINIIRFWTRAFYYDRSNQIRLFFDFNSPEETKPIPEYIQIKYVDQIKIKEWMEEDRYQETIKYLGSIWGCDVDGFRKFGRKRVDESESDYLDRVQSYIPPHNALIPSRLGEIQYVDLRQRYRMEIWGQHPISMVEDRLDSDDFVLWVSTFGNALSGADLHFDLAQFGSPALDYEIKGSSDSLADYVFFVREPLKFIKKRERVLVWRHLNLKKGYYELSISGKYKAKERLTQDQKQPRKLTPEYREWLVSEIWWETNRQVKLYVAEKGRCYFVNERQLFDENRNPSINFQGKLPEFESVPEEPRPYKVNQRDLNEEYRKDQEFKNFRSW